MLHLLLGRDWTANRDAVMERLAEDVRCRRGNRILIVPELISHEMERKLCTAAGDTASRYGEVLSFTRLYTRVTEAQNQAALACLDNGGRVVAMASAARQLSSKLKAYASVETKPEFLSSLIDAIDEFKRCCITSADLRFSAMQTEGSLAQKLEELSLLMESYDALCAQGKRDPRDRMTFLLELLEQGDFGKNHTFYIDGFPDFTRQNMAIVAHLIQVSPNVTITVNCDTPGSSALAFEKAADTAGQLLRCAQKAGVEVKVETIAEYQLPLSPVRHCLFQGRIPKGACQEHLHTFRAETPYQAALHAAQTVRKLVREGNRYRDITIVATDMAVYLPLLNLIFHRFHIPLYQAGTEDILQESALATVLTALDAALSGFEQRETLTFLRCAMSPLTPSQCDLVENYAIIWGIRGKKWTQDWVWHPEGLSGKWEEASENALREINELRSLAITPLDKLRQQFVDASNVREQVLAVYAFLEDIHLAQQLQQRAEQMDAQGDNRSAQILNQLWEILLGALEQLYDVLGSTYWDPEHFVRLLRLLLSQYNVGTIPPVLDAVQMGPVTAMRCHRQKHLIVLGAEEGSLPGYSGSSGILTDQERVALREMGVPLTGGAMEGIQAEFAEIYGVFCGATESIGLYCTTDQPSFVFRRLSELSGGVEHVDCETGFAAADAFEAGAYFAAHNCTEEAEQLHVLDAYRDTVTRRDYTLGKVGRKTIRKLYGDTLTLSASQIDKQAECRLSYFLQYGLRAKERKAASVDPTQFGTYVHAVLENTVRCIRDMGGFQKVPLQETLDIAHRYSEEYTQQHFSQLESERIAYLFRRNLQELDMVVGELWGELRESLFEPNGFEVNFGVDGQLPPIPIPNHAIGAQLRGFVDRVDTWNTGGSTYYRVVDYKTGQKDFDYCDVFNGVGLQMLLYLFALRDSGSDMFPNHPVPAGVQYFPARAPYLSTDGKPEEGEPEKLRLPEWKRKGLLLQDESVLQAMEPGEKPTRMSYTVKKDGTLSGDLADREQLHMLENYVFSVLAGLVEDIASGNVEPNPYTRGSSHNACTYCPYGAICHQKEVSGRRNYKAMKSTEFWEEIEKERKKNGG